MQCVWGLDATSSPGGNKTCDNSVGLVDSYYSEAERLVPRLPVMGACSLHLFVLKVPGLHNCEEELVSCSLWECHPGVGAVHNPCNETQQSQASLSWPSSGCCDSPFADFLSLVCPPLVLPKSFQCVITPSFPSSPSPSAHYTHHPQHGDPGRRLLPGRCVGCVALGKLLSLSVAGILI